VLSQSTLSPHQIPHPSTAHPLSPPSPHSTVDPNARRAETEQESPEDLDWHQVSSQNIHSHFTASTVSSAESSPISPYFHHIAEECACTLRRLQSVPRLQRPHGTCSCSSSATTQLTFSCAHTISTPAAHSLPCSPSLLDLPPPLDMLGHARWWFLPRPRGPPPSTCTTSTSLAAYPAEVMIPFLILYVFRFPIW
jgi:hypothetical protein